MWQIVACRLLCPHVYNIKNMNSAHITALSVAIETIDVSAAGASAESVSDETGQNHTVSLVSNNNFICLNFFFF